MKVSANTSAERRQVTALGYGWRLFRRRGLIATVRAIIYRYVYRNYRGLIFRTGLAGPPTEGHVGNVVFRLATASDLDHLAELERYGRGSMLRAGVTEDNDWLFVACHGDRIVATRRYSRVVPPHGLVSRVIHLEPAQVYMADIFCLPEYRSQGIARRLSLFGDRFLGSRGYTDSFAATEVTNTPSLRMSLHKGNGRPVYHVSYFRLLFYERLVISKDIPPKYWAEVVGP
jgi:GNAT superfamily N-acetyltransferase